MNLVSESLELAVFSKKQASCTAEHLVEGETLRFKVFCQLPLPNFLSGQSRDRQPTGKSACNQSG